MSYTRLVSVASHLGVFRDQVQVFLECPDPVFFAELIKVLSFGYEGQYFLAGAHMFILRAGDLDFGPPSCLCK